MGQNIGHPYIFPIFSGSLWVSYLFSLFALGSGIDQPQLHDDAYDYPDELIEIGARLYRAIIDRELAGSE